MQPGLPALRDTLLLHRLGDVIVGAKLLMQSEPFAKRLDAFTVNSPQPRDCAKFFRL
jgi:hypothetical protein